MSQYTSTATTRGGAIVNAVLDTVSNTITYTVTTPTGATATTVTPATDSGNKTTNVNAILQQIQSQGSALSLAGLATALAGTSADVTNQEAVARRESTATGNPPPAEQVAIPVNPANNPSPTPAPTEPPVPVQAEAINPNTDPNTNIGAEAQDFVFEPLQEPPIPEVDEFTGIDEQIERQRQLDDGTLEFAGIDEQVKRQQDLEDGTLEFAGIDEQIAANENTLQEPPPLSDEEVDNYFDQLRQEQIENSEPADVSGPTGTPYDDEGNLNPGWSLDEDNNPVWVGGDFVEPATQLSADQSRAAAAASRGLSTAQSDTRSSATQQDVANFKQKEDWRVRLSLAPDATYLYKEKDKEKRGILDPLATTDGVVFPYTPAISVQYAAHYDQTELTHSNYKYFQYKSSSVDQISITCDFTAQDTAEARYLLAVIHFFRSVTKMFYGQDNGPKPGTPPPLCYLTGLGAFQFDAHPLAITAFTYSLPTDVDYIRAGSVTAAAGVNQSRSNNPVNSSSATNTRLTSSNLNAGGTTGSPNWSAFASSQKPTYVPTKMQIQITAVPIVTRYDISQKFSLAKYGTGQLLQGTKRSGGGIW